jgi:hypothetical protein
MPQRTILQVANQIMIEDIDSYRKMKRRKSEREIQEKKKNGWWWTIF